MKFKGRDILKKLFQISGLFAFSFCFFGVVCAASFYISPSSGTYTVGQDFNVNIYVSSPDLAMNTAQGVVSFSQSSLKVNSVSKTGSIVDFWIQDPVFSNTAGTVTFEGVVLNPGFEGASGEMITINFRAESVGNVPVSFLSGLILANDGQGTNILNDMGTASYTIEPVTETVDTVIGEPLVPETSSPTHPDSNKWYALKDGKFVWTIFPSVAEVQSLVSSIPGINGCLLCNLPIIILSIALSLLMVLVVCYLWYKHIIFKKDKEKVGGTEDAFQNESIEKEIK